MPANDKEHWNVVEVKQQGRALRRPDYYNGGHVSLPWMCFPVPREGEPPLIFVCAVDLRTKEIFLDPEPIQGG